MAVADVMNVVAYKGRLSGDPGRTDQIQAIHGYYGHLVLAAGVCQWCDPSYAYGIPPLARLGQFH